MTGNDGAARLYTPEILGLAVELANYPLTTDHSEIVEVRSRSCGSLLKLGLGPIANETIQSFGLQVSACAIGQAAAGIFAQGAKGISLEEALKSLSAVKGWLAGNGAMPEWPGISALEIARSYPGRHGAILLPWRAAKEALSNVDLKR